MVLTNRRVEMVCYVENDYLYYYQCFKLIRVDEAVSKCELHSKIKF